MSIKKMFVSLECPRAQISNFGEFEAVERDKMLRRRKRERDKKTYKGYPVYLRVLGTKATNFQMRNGKFEPTNIAGTLVLTYFI